MISKTQIRYMANSSSYSKGAELYATGKVLDMDVKNMGASDENCCICKRQWKKYL